MTQLLYAYISKSQHAFLLNNFLHNFPEEFQEKILKYRRWEDAQLTILGRLLLKQGLKNVGEIYNENEIIYSKYKKPILKNDKIKFNISHSGTIVVCVLTDVNDIGIDIEKMHEINVKDFEAQMLKSEIAKVQNASNTQQAFFNYWTQKEAVIKAHGQGLYLPLQAFEVSNNTAQIADETFFVEEVQIDNAYKCHVAIKNIKFNKAIEITRVRFFEKR